MFVLGWKRARSVGWGRSTGREERERERERERGSVELRLRVDVDVGVGRACVFARESQSVCVSYLTRVHVYANVCVC